MVIYQAAHQFLQMAGSPRHAAIASWRGLRIVPEVSSAGLLGARYLSLGISNRDGVGPSCGWVSYWCQQRCLVVSLCWQLFTAQEPGWCAWADATGLSLPQAPAMFYVIDVAQEGISIQDTLLTWLLKLPQHVPAHCSDHSGDTQTTSVSGFPKGLTEPETQLSSSFCSGPDFTLRPLCTAIPWLGQIIPSIKDY